VSRDRDCYSLTKISDILGGRQRFGMRQRFDHFECGGAGHWELLPHLESTCTRINTSARRRTRPSAGPERSQLLQILPSLTVRQFFSGSAYISCCANIDGRLVFPVRQHFCRRQYFSMHQGFCIRQSFWMRQCFCIRQGFWMRQCFCIRQSFWMRQCFCIRQGFCIRHGFWMCQCFVYIFRRLYFCVFFCIQFNWCKCFEVFRLRLIVVVMIMYCVFLDYY
jgi:hypothetical protein